MWLYPQGMISWNSPPSFKASKFDPTLDQKKIKLHKQADPQEENFLYNFKMFYFTQMFHFIQFFSRQIFTALAMRFQYALQQDL